MPEAVCPNCGTSKFYQERGIANKIGTQINWYKPGVWWVRLAAVLVLALVGTAALGQFIPVLRGRAILFILASAIGYALTVFVRDTRASTTATKYRCQGCRLQWVLRRSDDWPSLNEALRQHHLLTFGKQPTGMNQS